jgi:hypothetical protein
MAMFIGTGTLLAVIVPFASVLLISSAPAAARGATCGSGKGTILAAGRQVRVYSLPGSKPPETERIFGCLIATGRSWQLNAVAMPPDVRQGRSVSVDTETLSLHAPSVAYPETFLGLDTSVLAVTVKDLRTGEVSYCRVGFRIAPVRSPLVTAIALKPGGSLAWMGESRLPQESGRASLSPEVGICDSTGSRILDSGQGIKLHSLALHGSRLTWTDSGVTHTAELR